MSSAIESSQATTPVQTVVQFGRALRRAGVAADQGRIAAAIEAMATLATPSRGAVYWAMRVTLCSTVEDLATFDRIFGEWFAFDRVDQWSSDSSVVDAFAAPVSSLDDGDDEDASDDRAVAGLAASRAERLAQAYFERFTDAERVEAARMIAALRPHAAVRRSRRTAPGRGHRIDTSRTVRLMLRNGGDLSQLVRRRRRVTSRRLAVLVDVSGSMAPFAEPFLRFAHAAVQAAPYRTEVFTMGTRLTRVTRQLRIRDPDAALATLGSAIPDWRGGTRLGESMRGFMDGWGQRGAARHATVVVVSDGWERGDASLLGEQTARLQRHAHSLVWVNPHRGKPGFEAATAGMQAVLPHIAKLVSGHNVDALVTLAQVIADA